MKKINALTPEEREEIYKKNKKIVIRFLKDIGLYKAWKDYLYTHRGRQECIGENWYKMVFTDSILGRTSFSSFLRSRYGIRLYSSSSEMLRYYIKANNIECYVSCCYNYHDVYKDIVINEATGEIELKYLKR